MSKLMLASGQWQGRGSYLHKDESLATQIECVFEVRAEEVGAHIKGTQSQKGGGKPHEFGVWITPNDTGTYDVVAQFTGLNLAGIAKLESFPNLGMLWSKDGSVQLAFSLFELRNARGFRGFCRTSEYFLSWEMVLESMRSAALRDAANVVSIDPRKRRR
jgi:hypothetical protein